MGFTDKKMTVFMELTVNENGIQQFESLINLYFIDNRM